MTTQNTKIGGKRGLVKAVMAKGVSARKAAQAVNAAFNLMKQALSYHEPVEVPGIGTLEVLLQKGNSEWRVQKTRNISTKQLEVHDVIHPGRRRIIKLTDPKLKLPVDPTPARLPAETPTAPNPTVRRSPIIAHTYRGGVLPWKPYRRRW